MEIIFRWVTVEYHEIRYSILGYDASSLTEISGVRGRFYSVVNCREFKERTT